MSTELLSPEVKSDLKDIEKDKSHWYIIAHQNVRKPANIYTTSMDGLNRLIDSVLELA